MPQRLCCGHGEPGRPSGVMQSLRQHGAPNAQVSRIKRHDRRHVPEPQGNGRGADAYVQVIVAVHHGVFGVVGQDPKQIAGQQQPGHRWHPALHRAKGHRNAKAKSDAQHRLRHRHDTLGIGVHHGHRQRGKRPINGGGIGRQHQAKGPQSQRCAYRKCFAHRHLAAGHRPLRGALDVAIKVPVGHIVDAAAGAAHEHRAQREHRQQMPARKAPCRQPQRAQRRPQQQ